ncbi:MAG TPA: hypothetical protein VMG12_31100 [Polyangiaceae bacterium]|nr:hypothetical protein [Polyangiaceae bacterium]
MLRPASHSRGVAAGSERRYRGWNGHCLAPGHRVALCSALLVLASCRRFDACGFDELPCDNGSAAASLPEDTPPAPLEPSPPRQSPGAAQTVPDSPVDEPPNADAPTPDPALATDPAPPAVPLDPSVPNTPDDPTIPSLPPSPAPADDAGPDAATSSNPDDDVLRPRLEATSPADGDGPITSERVALHFSEAMERSSVEAAFPLGDAFTWSDDGASVELHLPLPFGSVHQSFRLVVPGSVRNLAGVPIGADVEVRFTLAGVARTTLPLNFGMTGNKVGGDSGSGAFLMAGDVSGGGIRYTAASFSLAELPSFALNLGVRHATLQLQVCGIEGNPGEALGGIEVGRVVFTTRAAIDGSISVPDGDLGTLIEAGPLVAGQLVQLDVASPLVAAWESGEALLQLRFAPHGSNNNGVADVLYLRRVVDENNAVISEGVLDPDPDNAARIEVEFFY